MKSLELINIRKDFGSAVAVSGMNMTIRKGELVSLLGPSGCGKTTTLRMVAGFVEPTAGSIVINGRDVTHLPHTAATRRWCSSPMPSSLI
ncbi:ATP-binding cassette domain-containing protein [Breoghania sp. L-A4]|uniref:ATP-binding cassette domain-containing protein n=1 Tax=Breoghania sp. L-A4 TaxID=2304600 RepID=UPI0020BDA65A|nr:ATP-binding cassette domain-containing protein [Breoghania sp. L-A4]